MREKAEGLRADEEKVNRRQSAGSVLGLNAPAESKNLEDAQALDAAAAAAATLDYYNKTQHDNGDDTEGKEDDELSARERSLRKIRRPSKSPATRRESLAMQKDLERLLGEGDSDHDAGAAAGTPANKNKKAGAAAAASASKKKKKKKAQEKSQCRAVVRCG